MPLRLDLDVSDFLVTNVGEQFGELRLGERILALASLSLSGAAAAIAIDFALKLKPHVLLHQVFAYTLLWVLLISYVLAHHDGRRIVCTIIWLTTVVFCSFLCFIHLDDIPDRLVYRAANLNKWGLEEPGMTWRGRADVLNWSVFLNAAWLTLFSAHALWLGWRKRATPETDTKDGAA